MTTNVRDCKSFELGLDSYTHNYEYPLMLCNDNILCDREDKGDVVTTFPVPIIVGTEDSNVISVVGYMKVLMIKPDSRLDCIVINATRIIKCSNCGTSCEPETFEEDMGCIKHGDVLVTGDYIFSLPPQFNPAYEVIEGDSIRIVLEPLIDEHIYVKQYNV